MSTYFTDMWFVYLFHGIKFYVLVQYMYERLFALCLLILRICVSCLPFSQYTILLSGTLYMGTSNCFMSTYFTGMLLVYLFHGKLFYFLVHYM